MYSLSLSIVTFALFNAACDDIFLYYWIEQWNVSIVVWYYFWLQTSMATNVFAYKYGFHFDSLVSSFLAIYLDVNILQQ